MTFDELKLVMAINRTGVTVRDAMPASDRMTFAIEVMTSYVGMFGDTVFPFSVDRIIFLATLLRKSTKARVKADVATIHGLRCFWEDRGKGPCSTRVECGHLVPSSVGGKLSLANCVIECRAHNNQRRDMTIEQYLNSPLTTEEAAELPTELVGRIDGT